MKIRQAGRYITFNAETEAERDDLEALAASDVAGQQFRVDSVNAETLSLRAAGPSRKDTARADRVKAEPASAGANAGPNAEAGAPINITFDVAPMPLLLISNLAETPFELHGRDYASVEGFWQGLKLASEIDRQRLASLSGHAAKNAGASVSLGDRISYDGRDVVVGTVEHWELMEQANVAKFEQHAAARAALLSTRGCPLMHKVPVDSRTIPGIVMADIWMRIREQLSKP